MKHLLMLGVATFAVIAVTSTAFAASDAGGRKLRPAHGTMEAPAIEHFKAVKEAAYNNRDQSFTAETAEVEGFAYGDQPNKIPAKERFYSYGKGNTQPTVTYQTR